MNVCVKWLVFDWPDIKSLCDEEIASNASMNEENLKSSPRKEKESKNCLIST